MDEVWRILPLPPGTYRYVFAKAGTVVEGTWVRNAVGLQAFANRHAHSNCYITLNPAGSPNLVRPSAKDITHVQAILIDIDPIEPSAQPGEALWEAQDLLQDMGLDRWAMSVVDSGRGIQIWIHVRPMVADPILAATARNFVLKVSERFGQRHGCVIDSSCTDLARLARLPGTVNQKTKETSFIAVIGEEQSAKFLFPFQDLEPVSSCPPPPGLRTTWPQAVMYLTHTASEFIQHGVEQTRRHKACFATAKSLKEAGVPEEIGIEWILKGSERCDPPLESTEALRILKKVYAGD